MLDRIVALVTLVIPKAALIVQLAMNQKKQNISARCTVSFSVKGSFRELEDTGVLVGTCTACGGSVFAERVQNNVSREPPVEMTHTHRYLFRDAIFSDQRLVFV